jgi:hypothetical protein
MRLVCIPLLPTLFPKSPAPHTRSATVAAPFPVSGAQKEQVTVVSLTSPQPFQASTDHKERHSMRCFDLDRDIGSQYRDILPLGLAVFVWVYHAYESNDADLLIQFVQ